MGLWKTIPDWGYYANICLIGVMAISYLIGVYYDNIMFDSGYDNIMPDLEITTQQILNLVGLLDSD